jgi:hypothetical protein
MVPTQTVSSAQADPAGRSRVQVRTAKATDLVARFTFVSSLLPNETER